MEKLLKEFPVKLLKPLKVSFFLPTPKDFGSLFIYEFRRKTVPFKNSIKKRKWNRANNKINDLMSICRLFTFLQVKMRAKEQFFILFSHRSAKVNARTSCFDIEIFCVKRTNSITCLFPLSTFPTSIHLSPVWRLGQQQIVLFSIDQHQSVAIPWVKGKLLRSFLMFLWSNLIN